MNRVVALLYGTVCYLIFFGTFPYSIGFLANFAVPKSIDSGVRGDATIALLINLALLSVFAVQHSVMARIGFKKWWTRFVPEPVERSTYVLASSAAMVLLFWGWQPMTTEVFRLESEAARLTALSGAQLLFYPTAIGWQFDEGDDVDSAQHDAWETIQRGHAIANGIDQ